MHFHYCETYDRLVSRVAYVPDHFYNLINCSFMYNLLNEIS